MNPIRKIKAWRDRRFQKRVLKAPGAEINDSKDRTIIFDRDVVSKHDIQSFTSGHSAEESDEHGGGAPV